MEKNMFPIIAFNFSKEKKKKYKTTKTKTALNLMTNKGLSIQKFIILNSKTIREK